MPATTQSPALVEQIEEYIRQHSYWKNNILAAIKTGKSEFQPAAIRCAFGKWLYSASDAVRADPHYETVKRLHAEFHQKASKTLADALSGRREQALEDLEKGEYSDASAALIVSMSRWRRSV